MTRSYPLPAADTQRATSPQSLFFRSHQVAAHWDTWMTYHNGVFFLYYLITEVSPGEGFGLATSTDGVTWFDHGWIVSASEQMVTYLGTGAVWQAIDFSVSGTFLCNYSEWRLDHDGRECQNIFFAKSQDLRQWNKFGDTYMFRVDPRWYDPFGRWDCIYAIPRPQGGYYGYWTATPKGTVGFGFGESNDGVHWEAHPAPMLEWEEAPLPPSMELGAVELINGRYYAITGQSEMSMRTMVADAPQGPFRRAAKNYLLLGNPGPHKHTYFARFFRHEDELLVNHHAITRSRNTDGRPICYFAPLKRAHVDDEGTLWLAYWSGNERAKQMQLTLNWETQGTNGQLWNQNPLPVSEGIVIEGLLNLPTEETDRDMWPGLWIGHAGQVVGQGAVIQVGPYGSTSFGLLDKKEGHFVHEDLITRAWPFGNPVRFRLLLRDSVLEFYLDDILIQSFSLPDVATGRLGLIGHGIDPANISVWSAGQGSDVHG